MGHNYRPNVLKGRLDPVDPMNRKFKLDSFCSLSLIPLRYLVEVSAPYNIYGHLSFPMRSIYVQSCWTEWMISVSFFACKVIFLVYHTSILLKESNSICNLLLLQILLAPSVDDAGTIFTYSLPIKGPYGRNTPIRSQAVRVIQSEHFPNARSCTAQNPYSSK
ncbi:unnamed protein product [Albugo candida]|uniref:Uncharacterized protein n=1 Tax=Albugo candida TaxID=65357 RepID=A0A024FUI7_9STRA|nr:unnamed protein product [Albugo candida]CCI11400.1 unnamed protein product [Albugo candida]|eukprot:CCI10562.1 unnamed protein product [Albugo candida]